jgi:hypothetical protein
MAAKDLSTVTHAWLQGQENWRLDGCQLERLVFLSLAQSAYRILAM